jgi:hypothetical protein
MHHTNQGTEHTKIDTTTQPNDLETPPKAPLSPPSKAFVHRLYNSRTSGLPPSPVLHTNTATPREPECHTIPVLTPLQRHSQTLLSSFLLNSCLSYLIQLFNLSEPSNSHQGALPQHALQLAHHPQPQPNTATTLFWSLKFFI